VAVPPSGAGTRPRRWPRRLLIAINLFLALCIVGVGAGYGYLRWRFGQIDSISIPGLRNHGDDDPGQPMNVLLVGSDTRSDLTGTDCKRNCFDLHGRRVTGQRSDTIMILHADPRARQGSILSIPRDLWVAIAGTTHHSRINSAFQNGPDELIRTITQDLGIPIDHYAEVDFVGFRNLVNAVNGVPIYVPAPARDFYSDLRIPTAGCITLSGDQALGWVRSRHYQYFEAGRWHSDLTSDFGRILRQQDFIRRLMKRSISKGIRNPFTLNRLIGIAVKNLKIDSAMSSKDILRLGRQFKSLDPDSVSMYTLPTTPAVIGGADVLRMKQPDAAQLIAQFTGQSSAAQRPPNILPSTIRVRTLNGAGVSGLAGRAASGLESFGFQNAGTGDADTFRYATTVVKYGRGQLDKGRLVQAYLRAGGQLVEDDTLSVDVVLIAGRDYAGVARPVFGATTTTRPLVTTTTAPPSPVPVPKGAPPQPQC
jgi:polyisoprenyl-teichoic acid--peptidoglycan teichoic acid transferase